MVSIPALQDSISTRLSLVWFLFISQYTEHIDRMKLRKWLANARFRLCNRRTGPSGDDGDDSVWTLLASLCCSLSDIDF